MNMLWSKIFTVLFLLLAFLVIPTFTYAGSEVEEFLAETDTWITKDTTRILSFVDSCNALTKSVLEGSPYWATAYRDLSFLLGIDYVENPQIDNTGRMYFLMRITGEEDALFYVDQSIGWPHQMTPNNWPSEGLSIGYYDVHPSGKYVLVGVMRHGNENHDVYLFERDGRFRPLIQDENVQYRTIVFKNEDEFFLMSDDNKNLFLLKYTISSGKLDTLYTEEESFDPEDYRDGKLLCSRWFSFSESQLFIYDPEKNKATDVTKRGLFWGGYFTLDGQIVTLTSDLSSKDEFMKFATIDPARPKKVVFLYDPKLEIDEYLLIRNSSTVVAILNKDGYSQLLAFDLKGNPVDLPQPEIGVVGELSTNEFGEVVFGFSSPRTAPVCYKFRLGTNSLDQVASTSTFGFDFSDIKVEVIHYRSSDGMQIPALLYYPLNAKKDGTNPAIVVYHGGPPSQSRPYFQRNVAFALSRGIILLFPNVRGSTGYGPAFEETDNLEGRGQSLVDCEMALDYLVEQGWTGYDRLAIWGGSYGGYVVNYLSVKAPDKFACAVSEVGMSDIDHNDTLVDLTFRKGWERELGPVGSELTHRLSPIFYAENVKRPIFLTGGFNDPRVPASDARRFSLVLSKLGKDVIYYEEVEAGHGGVTKSQVIKEYARSYVFMLDHIMK
jgi:dipeptidyl aminopeptidase/acylaminoacyl peptidase